MSNPTWSEAEEVDFEEFCFDLETPVSDPELARLLDPSDFGITSSFDDIEESNISYC